MKRPISVVNKRRDDILNYLKNDPQINNDQLAVLLNTSTLTIRRDLKSLEDKGVVRRHYGGATVVYKEKNTDEAKEVKMPAADFLSKNADKESIARCAANLIEEDDIIFINSSSTALAILKYIGNKHVVVVTNNCNILKMKLPHNVELMMTGGQVNIRNNSMVGDFAAAFLQNISVSKCFIGASGIDYKSGISTVFMQETHINKEIIRRSSGKVYVVAESYKVKKSNNFSSGSIDQISYFITDKNISDRYKQEFENAGVEIIIA